MKFASRSHGRSPRRGFQFGAARPARVAFEAFEPRRLLSATLAQAIPTLTYNQGSGQQAIDLNAFFYDSNSLPLTLTAKSDNPALLSADVASGILTFTVSDTNSGFAHVQVVATSADGSSASDTVRVKVLASQARSTDVTLQSGQSFHYTQADHTAGSISLNGPGSAVIHLTGDNLQQAGNHARGSNQQVAGVSLTGTTSATTLSITGRPNRKQYATIGDITTDGSLRSLVIKKVTVLGDVTAAGGVTRLDADSADGGSITFGANAAPMNLKIGTFVDENFSSASPISQIKASQWFSSDSVPESFSADYVKNLRALGSFQPGLQLSGTGAPKLTLGHNRIGGYVGGNWQVTGASAPLIVGGTTSDWQAQFTSLPWIRDYGNFSGSLSAPSLKMLKIYGSMDNAGVFLTSAGTNDLNQLIVKGTITVSGIEAAGNIGTIQAQSLQQSVVYAGVGPLASGQALPASASDFTSPATIHSISLHPRKKVIAFVGSDVAAANIGTLSLRNIRTVNGGVTFGVAARKIGHIGGTEIAHHRTFAFSNVTDAAGLASQMAAKGLNLGDMVIRII